MFLSFLALFLRRCGFFVLVFLNFFLNTETLAAALIPLQGSCYFPLYSIYAGLAWKV